MHQDLPLDVLSLLHVRQFHTIIPKTILPSFLYVRDSFHRLNGLHVEITVVLQRLISLLLEFENRVLDDLFVVKFA